MKFAIVAHGYSGATLPLANHLAKAGHTVVCYYFCWNGSHTMESLDYGKKITEITTLSLDNSIYNYLDKGVQIVIVPVHNLKSKTSFIKKEISDIINKYRLRELIKIIKSQHFDLVNVLLYTEFDYKVLKALYQSGVRCCQTYHEVLSVLTDKQELLPIVKKGLLLDTPIVLHSENTKKDLVSNWNINSLEDRIHIIHFGPFESYLQYGEGKKVENVDQNSLLYLGFIKPYKGLKYLYEASKLLPENITTKIIVAGGGYDEALAKMNGDDRFVVINRFIDNDELVWLIKKCKAIICPYIAASQSGLVQTAMVYNKPVIATKVGAFVELIQEGKNGYLVNSSDSIDLGTVIHKFCLSDFNYQMPYMKELDWQYIAQQYISIMRE